VNALLGIDNREADERQIESVHSDAHQADSQPIDLATASVMSSPTTSVPNHEPAGAGGSEMTPIANRFRQTLPGTGT